MFARLYHAFAGLSFFGVTLFNGVFWHIFMDIRKEFNIRFMKFASETIRCDTLILECQCLKRDLSGANNLSELFRCTVLAKWIE